MISMRRVVRPQGATRTAATRLTGWRAIATPSAIAITPLKAGRRRVKGAPSELYRLNPFRRNHDLVSVGTFALARLPPRGHFAVFR